MVPALVRAFVAAWLAASGIACLAATGDFPAGGIVVTDERAARRTLPQPIVDATPRHEPFASFAVRDHDVPDGPEFVFSAARATSDDPVFITVTGRKMRAEDRSNRVDLQKHWLSVNVPDAYEVLERSLVECKPPGTWQFPFCDLYVFVDPPTGEQHEYFLFVGNWP